MASYTMRINSGASNKVAAKRTSILEAVATASGVQFSITEERTQVFNALIGLKIVVTGDEDEISRLREGVLILKNIYK